MERVSLDDLDRREGTASDERPVSRGLGATNLALKYYELEPGDSFGFGYHYHADQEEVFFVLEGTATFETEGGDVEVGADEAVRFAPGEWQLGRNEGEERVVALAMGAPAETGGGEMRRECPDCGERTPNTIERDDDVVVTRCEVCGAETGRFT